MQSRPAISALVSTFASHLISFLKSAFRSRITLVAENLFLRKQLAFYREHKIKPQPLTDAARLSLVLWSRLFDWKSALMIVKPETLTSWHRKGFKLFWRWKSRRGRPPVPETVRELIVRMARENPARCLVARRGDACRTRNGSPSSSNPNVGAFVSRAKERLRNSLNALNGVNGGIDSLCAGRWLISICL